MKKRFLAGMLAAMLSLSMLCSCGGNTEKTTENSSQTLTTSPEKTTEISTEASQTTEELTQETTTIADMTESTSEEATSESTEATLSEAEKMALLKERYVNLFIVTAESLNLREEAGSNQAIIGALSKYSAGEVAGEERDGWTPVCSGMICGFVSSEFILTGEAAYELAAKYCDNEGNLKEAYAVERIEPTEETTAGAPSTQPEGTNITGLNSPQSVSTGTNGLTVCIDAGHQQHGISEKEQNAPGSSVMKAKLTTGTQGVASGVPEYVVNLQVALKLQAELEARGYGVVMIRTTNDCAVSNRERALVANEYGSDCFIRIHCNSLTNSSVQGVMSYTPSSSNAYVPEPARSRSYTLSALMNQYISAATGAVDKGILYGDDMTGINWCTVPVTIVEMGFMSNPDEDLRLVSDDYQTQMAAGMANAIDAFFGISR